MAAAGRSTGTSVVIEGGPELRRSLRALGADLRDLSALHRSIASDVARQVSSAAPKLTGKLAGSFRPSGTRTMARVRSSLVYAPIQNYGWPAHGIEGTGFAEQALEASKGDVEAKYRAGIERLLRKAEGH